MPSAGQFSCESCGKSYSWKTELAGKKVKCKCGQPMRVPATDPSLADASDGLDDLAALGEGAVAETQSYAPAPVAGPSCPSCGSSVDAAAVICINCGHNLKTGKKLKTTKASASDSAPAMPGYRSYKMDNTEEPMSDKKKKILAYSLSAALIIIVGVVRIVTRIASNREDERQRIANLNAKPGKTEQLITRSEKSGGLVEAMTQGVTNARMAKQEGDLERKRHEERVKERGTELTKTKGPLAKTWLESSPKTRIAGRTHDTSLALLKELEALNLSDIYCIAPPKPGPKDEIVTTGFFATLPGDADGRDKIFDWQDNVPKRFEMEGYYQYEVGQAYFWIELKD